MECRDKMVTVEVSKAWHNRRKALAKVTPLLLQRVRYSLHHSDE